MKINKNQLLAALEVVRPGLAKNDRIEQTTSFAFVNNRVVTYNDAISISHLVEGFSLTGAIQADNFFKFLGKIKKEEIELEVIGNEIILTSGRSRAGITLESEIKLPLDQDITEQGDWYDLPENFMQAMRFVVSSCSKSMDNALLTCVHVSKKGFVEASDNHRITKYHLMGEMPVKTFLLPSTSVLHMIKLQPKQISEGNGWIHFKTEEETVISCRIFEDAYPETDRLFNVEGKTVTFPKNMEEVLERAGVFAKRDEVLDESINITITNRKLHVRAENEGAWFEEDVKMVYEGDVIEFNVTPMLIKRILTETLICTIGSGKLKFEGVNWEHITVLRGDK